MDSKEMFENKKIELQNIDKIVRVKHSPTVSTFISLIKTVPCFLDLFDDSLEYILQNFQNKKQQQLLDFINNTSEGIVTSDMVNDVEFIMNFAKTMKAVNMLTNGDKVKFYGNLLVNGYLSARGKILTDEFEEYLELINSLSYRELEYLLFFKEFSDRYTGKLVHQSWNEFSTEFRNKFQNRDAYVVYKRLQRTGFISEVIETANIRGETLLLDNNFIGFEVEPEFNRFNEMVLKKIDNT